MRAISYVAENTPAKFHHSEKVVRGIRGPVGSGKSVACINELHRLAIDQWPNDAGIRKSRWAIVRNTTPELRTTTLKTFKQWIPEELCPIVTNPVITGTLKYDLLDKTKIEAEFLFLALDEPKDVRKLLSLELTGVFINEAREVLFAVVKAARERIGRYPSKIDGYEDNAKAGYTAPAEPCKRKALIMDTNPPDDLHWWYQLAENGYLEGTPEENVEYARTETERVFDFFSTPAPLIDNKDGSYSPSPKAENIDNLPGGYQYYLDMIPGNTKEHINVMVLGNYGAIQEGKPVYPEYNDQFHCGTVRPIPSLPLGLGWDFGLTPSLVITQLNSLGQFRVTDELSATNMDVRQFARDVVKPFLSLKYAGYWIAFSVGDPSGNNRGEGEGHSAIGILNDDYVEEDGLITPLNMGFRTEPAPTNDITKRLDAVKSFLIKTVGQGQPGYYLEQRCKLLRKGKQGKYEYKRIQGSGEFKYHEKPNKNMFSHVSDAEQYAALAYLHGYDQDNGEDENLDYEYAEGASDVTGY